MELRPRETRLDELARRIAGLDLVVSVDGEVAHLAGALGRPLVVLLDAAGGWAWPRPEGALAFYPQARVLRQTTHGDFGPVLQSLRAIAGGDGRLSTTEAPADS